MTRSKGGIPFDPELGSGIPTTTLDVEPVNLDRIREATGARAAEAFIDIDITGKKTRTRRTKAGPEIVVEEDITVEDIKAHGRVKKSKGVDDVDFGNQEVW